MRLYRSSIALLSVVLVGLGLVLLVQALVAQRVAGAAIGALFVVAGAGRLFLLRRR